MVFSLIPAIGLTLAIVTRNGGVIAPIICWAIFLLSIISAAVTKHYSNTLPAKKK
jgi:hypothetical protein